MVVRKASSPAARPTVAHPANLSFLLSPSSAISEPGHHHGELHQTLGFMKSFVYMQSADRLRDASGREGIPHQPSETADDSRHHKLSMWMGGEAAS